MTNYIEYTLNEKLNGRKYSDIKNELKIKGISDHQIKEIINSADDKFLDTLNPKRRKQLKFNNRLFGIVLILVGISTTVYTYIFSIDGSFLIVYGPILSGLALLVFDKANVIRTKRDGQRDKFRIHNK